MILVYYYYKTTVIRLLLLSSIAWTDGKLAGEKFEFLINQFVFNYSS